MSTTCCPICTLLYEGSNDHPRAPCKRCWMAGWRVDSCGNVRKAQAERLAIPTERAVREIRASVEALRTKRQNLA